MITRLDDFPVHQTSGPVARPATGDRNHYDRYFFNGYSIDDDGGPDGQVFFAAAMGRYPNRQVQDAALSVVVDGVQHSLHASGRAPLDPFDTSCGPVRIDVEEPLAALRITVDEHDGVAADLLFQRRTFAVEEPGFLRRSGPRVVMDYTRLTQFGTWTGWIQVPGHRIELEAERTRGCRDRSWGIRTVGEPESGGAPRGELPQFFWLWAPLNFADGCLHFDVNETERGERWHESGFVVPLTGDADDAVDDGRSPASAEPVRHVDWSIVWRPGTRRAHAAELRFERWNADPLTVTLTPVLDFPMFGIGYFHPRFAHGVWVGEEEVEVESLRLADLDPTAVQHLHVQQLVRAEDGDRTGAGILEQLVIGPHRPSGISGLFDPA